jgi:hypothetical protein
MRDVLTVINGILCANSLSRGLSHGVPPVLQRHLAAMEAEVMRSLAPSRPGSAAASDDSRSGESTSSTKGQLQGQVRRQPLAALTQAQP